MLAKRARALLESMSHHKFLVLRLERGLNRLDVYIFVVGYELSDFDEQETRNEHHARNC